MKGLSVSVLLLIATVIAYEFPSRLTSEEDVELQKTCGRKPQKIDFSVTSRPKRSAFSTLTNRTMAPWAVDVWCSGVLISKRHILTNAHCVWNLNHDGMWHKSAGLGKAMFGMTCTRGSQCPEKHILYEIAISEIALPLLWIKIGFPYLTKRDIAVIVLAKDVELSDLIYPACLAANTKEEKRQTGLNRAWHLQKFTAIREEGIYFRDTVYMNGIKPNRSSRTHSGDSGSGFIHTRNDIHSVYSIESYSGNGLILNMGSMRVSAHLFWISQVTGINVIDEDDQFDGYFFPLIYKDNRIKKTYEVGARHPNKSLPYRSITSQ